MLRIYIPVGICILVYLNFDSSDVYEISTVDYPCTVSLVPVWREDDGFVRLVDPNSGKGRELFGYLQSVNEGDAELKLEGKEIVIQGLE